MDQLFITAVPLKDAGDDRGSSFVIPDKWLDQLGGVRDTHITTLRPGGIRGDHYHVARNELLTILHTDSWSLHFDSGPETAISRQDFQGAGAVLIVVPRHMSHAIRNDGGADLTIIGMTDGVYDADNPDAYPRIVAR